MNTLYPAIDLVYTWVDGSAPEHQHLSQQYAQRRSDVNPERTRDLYTLLKYSLRSVAQFAPWLRTIYIITCRPQTPTWLNCTHPRIKIVHHDEIFDNPLYLPTFNCNCIESYLHRVPGLSDYFLYLNDDFLFGSPVTPHDFITTEGTLLVYGTVFGERIPFIYDNLRNDLVSRFQHHPILVHKPYYEAMLRERPQQVHQTRSRRFRSRADVMMHGLYRYYLLSRQTEKSRAVSIFQYHKYYRFHKITNHYNSQARGFARLQAMRPKFYCLNDDQRDYPDPAVVQLVQSFLADYYPHPSEYEQ